MSWNSKVIWSEGMLLQPQHLQQHDRYLQTQLEARVRALRPYAWGFSELVIDQQQLALGKVALASFSAVLPDGTPAGAPCEEVLPAPLAIPADARDLNIVLALPARRHGVPEVDDHFSSENAARHRSTEYEARDSNGLDNSALMQVGQLRLRLAFEQDVADTHVMLGVARVVERRPDQQVVLDAAFCPPVLEVRAAAMLSAFVDELLGLLRQRGEALAARLAQPGSAGAAEIADFLLLQLLNRSQPLAAHLASMRGLHPEDLYRELVQLAGELSTFNQGERLCASYPAYRHDALAATFAPVMLDLRRTLSAVLDFAVVPIPLEDRQFGIRVAVLPDQELLRNANFVLAVNAQMPAEAVRSGFPPQVKIGSVETIRDLVNLQLPGVALRPLPVAPRQLPFLSGYTYFELDRSGDAWQQLHHSAGFALHVAGSFPGLHMQFWAIRQQGGTQ